MGGRFACFLQPEGKSYRMRQELRDRIVFRQLNLIGKRYPGAGQFDAIFCRNVLIYFDDAQVKATLERLLACLRPNGYLFVGRTESAACLGARVACVEVGVYRKVGHD